MTDGIIKNISDRIQAFRKDNRLSIKRLSEISRVPPAGIHKIENDYMIPTTGVLMKLAKAFNKKSGYFVEDEEVTRDIELVRRKDRKKLYSLWVHSGWKILPGAWRTDFSSESSVLSTQKGIAVTRRCHIEEMVLIMENVIEFKIRNKIYHLSKGDCLHFFPSPLLSRFDRAPYLLLRAKGELDVSSGFP